MSKVLVLGGGIAGVEAAIQLRRNDHEVTLISNRDYLFVYPISIWIPVHSIEFEDVAVPLEKLARLHGFVFDRGEVARIRAKEHAVELADGRVLTDYNYLVLAMGQGKTSPKGVENTLSICGDPNTSLEIRNRLDAVIAAGAGRIAIGFSGNPIDPSALRGGPAFELLFNIDHYLRRKGLRDKIDIAFFAPMAEPGARMGDKAVPTLRKFFAEKGISQHVGVKITGFEPKAVVFEDESRLEADLILFIPGGSGHPIYKQSDLPLSEAGYVRADENSLVEGFEDVFAIGDGATLLGPEWRAKQGHVAEVMARGVAENIGAMERGSAARQSYVPHVNILCVMDTGNAAVMVSRTTSKQRLVPMPVVGHTMKKAWGFYYRNSKLRRMPRLPSM
jgi:sulfide:quinone oxidoreductase